MKTKRLFLLAFVLAIASLMCAKDDNQSALAGLELASTPARAESLDNKNATNSDVSDGRTNAITRAVQQVSDAVCGINVTQIREYYRSPFYDDAFLRFFFPEGIARQPVKSLGSGFLISAAGYILTNQHVVDKATEIVVVLSDGSTKTAQLIGEDGVSDIALLKIEGENHPYVTFGNSDEVIIGEWVIALGNPLGLFEINAKPTVTVGVVSAVDRDFGKLKNNRVYQDMIQTDASINRGNSGGPLVNSLGQVIGMNTFIFTSSDYNTGSIGLGFALPINRVKRVLKELKEKGEVNRRFWSGLEVDDITPLVARYFRLKSRTGVIVTHVTTGSPAASAGLEIGDIIVEINNTKITSRSDIWSVIEDSDLRGGDRLELVVIRDRKRLKMVLRLEGISEE